MPGASARASPSPAARPYQKNDSAHVEQKNGAIVRPLIGYDRYASKAAYAQLARVYDLARLHINFFQPVQQLVRKERRGPRVHRVYDRAPHPVSAARGQRTCSPPLRRQELEAVYQRLNPLHLRRQLETTALDRLWTLAVPPRIHGPHKEKHLARGIGSYGLAPNSRSYGLFVGARGLHPEPCERPQRPPRRGGRPTRRPAPPGLTLHPHGAAPSARGPRVTLTSDLTGLGG